MMICQNCGNQVPDGSAFCGNCGTSLKMEPAGNRNNQSMYGNQIMYGNERLSVNPNTALRTLTSKLKTSANLWTAIGIYQIVAGIFLLIFGYGLLSIILGIWNIVQSSKARKNAEYFQRNPVGIVSFFEAGKSSSIIGLIINLVFGAIIGVIGSMYDLSINNYVLSHRDAFSALERS